MKKIIYKQSELYALPLQTYCRPLSKSFAAIDSLVLPSSNKCVLFQSTVSLDHPVKRQRLQDIIDNITFLAGSVLFQFCFVVPMHLFHIYKRQNYINVDGKVSQTQDFPNVQQFAIGIDLSPTSSTSTAAASVATSTISSSSSTSSTTIIPPSTTQTSADPESRKRMKMDLQQPL